MCLEIVEEAIHDIHFVYALVAFIYSMSEFTLTSFLQSSNVTWKGYRYGQTNWQVSDRFERLVAAVAEILVTLRRKHFSETSVLDSSSSLGVVSAIRCVSEVYYNRYQFSRTMLTRRQVICPYLYHELQQWLRIEFRTAVSITNCPGTQVDWLRLFNDATSSSFKY